jgi:hypothetical protein
MSWVLRLQDIRIAAGLLDPSCSRRQQQAECDFSLSLTPLRQLCTVWEHRSPPQLHAKHSNLMLRVWQVPIVARQERTVVDVPNESSVDVFSTLC